MICWHSLLSDNCTNYAQMADIMRLEIVYLYGGIYVDMDATALRPFGKLDNYGLFINTILDLITRTDIPTEFPILQTPKLAPFWQVLHFNTKSFSRVTNKHIRLRQTFSFPKIFTGCTEVGNNIITSWGPAMTSSWTAQSEIAEIERTSDLTSWDSVLHIRKMSSLAQNYQIVSSHAQIGPQGAEKQLSKVNVGGCGGWV